MPRLETADGAFAFLMAHADRVGLAAYDTADPAGGIFHRPGVPQPGPARR